MNISVKGEYALHAIFDLALQTAGRADQDRRYRAAAEDSAEVPGADSGGPETGWLRGIAARRRRRLSAGASAGCDHRGRSSAFRGRRQDQEVRPKQRAGDPFAETWRVWTRRSRASSTRLLSPNWCATGATSRPSTCRTGRFNAVSRQFVEYRTNAAGEAQPRSRRRARHHTGEDRGPESGLLGEGPDRRFHDLGRGEARGAWARARS